MALTRSALLDARGEPHRPPAHILRLLAGRRRHPEQRVGSLAVVDGPRVRARWGRDGRSERWQHGLKQRAHANARLGVVATRLEVYAAAIAADALHSDNSCRLHASTQPGARVSEEAALSDGRRRMSKE